MTENNSKEEAIEFWKLAKEDFTLLKGQLYLLELTSDEVYIKSACLYIYQCTEKLLKYLIFNEVETGIFSHDIRKLNFRCEQLQIPTPKMISENEEILSNWAIATRYKINFKAELEIVYDLECTLGEWIENIEALQDI